MKNKNMLSLKIDFKFKLIEIYKRFYLTKPQL